jgi:hypothetical protein
MSIHLGNWQLGKAPGDASGDAEDTIFESRHNIDLIITIRVTSRSTTVVRVESSGERLGELGGRDRNEARTFYVKAVTQIRVRADSDAPLVSGDYQLTILAIPS